MNKQNLMNVLLAPVITEKATMAGELNNQYVFEVTPGAAKPDIKAAVEQMFNVKVDSVTVSNVKGKLKRFGQRPGRRKNWRKAYVRLQPGQEIDFTGSAE